MLICLAWKEKEFLYYFLRWTCKFNMDAEMEIQIQFDMPRDDAFLH